MVSAFGFIFISPVYGHANPVSYIPQVNQIFSSIEDIPSVIKITFTERPEPKASNIQVFDQNNIRVDNNDFTVVDSKTASITLDKSKLNPGTYTVKWIVLSKDDGHITKGSYVFSIQTTISQQENKQISSNQSSIFSKNLDFDELKVKVDISPLRVGANTFNITVTDNNGNLVESIRNIFLEFSNPAKDLGPIVDTMTKTFSGKYTTTGSFISQSGDWEIKIIIQRINAYDLDQILKLNVM